MASPLLPSEADLQALLADADELVPTHGLGAVAIRNSSHFGAAGAYALDIAQQGMMGLAVCNSDAFVRLHGGRRFPLVAR